MRASILLAGLMALGLMACDFFFGSEPEKKPPPPTEAEWPRVAVAPNELRVARVGVPLTIEARVTDILGEPMADYPWEWVYDASEHVEVQPESPEPGIERLAVTLLRASPRAGDAFTEATFTAVVRMCPNVLETQHGCVRRFAVVVHAWGGPAAEVRLSTEAMTVAPGEARPVAAMARRADGDASDEAVTFESDTPGVATVDALGVVRGVAPGVARVMARAGAASAEVVVTVAAGAAYVPAFEEPTPMTELASGLALRLASDMEEVALWTARGTVLAGVLEDASVRSRPVAVIREWTGTGWSTEQVSEPFELPEQVRVAEDGLGTLYVLYRDALRGRPVVAWRQTGDGGTPGGWQREVLEVIPRPVAAELASLQQLWVLDRERSHPRERVSIVGRPGGGAWVSHLEVSAPFPCHDAHFLGTVTPGAPEAVAIELATFRSWGDGCWGLDPDVPRIERTVLVDGGGFSAALGTKRVPHWWSSELLPSTFRGEPLPGFPNDGTYGLQVTVAMATFGDRRYWFTEETDWTYVGGLLGDVHRDELRGLGGNAPRAVLANLPRVFFLGSEGDRWWWSSVELPRGATFTAGSDDIGADATGPWRLTATRGVPLDLAALPDGGLVVAHRATGNEWESVSFLTYRASEPGVSFELWGATDRHWTPEPAGPMTVVDNALYLANGGAVFRSDDDGASWWLHGSVPRWSTINAWAEQALLADGRTVVVLARELGPYWDLQPWLAEDVRVPTAFWPGPIVRLEDFASPTGKDGVVRGTRALPWPADPGEDAATTLVVGFLTPPELWTLGFGDLGLEVLERRTIDAPVDAGNKVLWASHGLLLPDGAFLTFAQNAGDITSGRPLLRVDLATAEATTITLPEAFYAEPFIAADMALPPVLVELADGRILVAAGVPVEAEGPYDRTRAVYSVTSDGGATWTTPVQLLPDGGNGQVVFDAAVPASGGVVLLFGDNGALSTSPRSRAWPLVGPLTGNQPPPMAPLFVALPSP